MKTLPDATEVVIVGAGFAGTATGAALARLGVGPGVILEREALPGTHASGRNASLAPQVEDDPLVGELALAGARWLRERSATGPPLMQEPGALYLGSRVDAGFFDAQCRLLLEHGLRAEVWSRREALGRLEFLHRLEFETALFSARDGVIDIHALLLDYLQQARDGGIPLVTDCEVLGLLVEAGRARGVVTARGEVRANLVVDATGAWAGRLGRESHPLPLRPYRRHLFVSGPTPEVPEGAPWVWDHTESYYFRREGPGLLLSPCDQTEHPPGLPSVDADAQVLLAEKLSRHAPGLGNLVVRSGWACLRTFAPDRRPLIGPDPTLPGLFHVSGLGGFGASTSPAIGKIAAALVTGRPVPYIDAASVDPRRFSALDRC